jgi:uncharacterized membrane protein
MTPPTGPGRVDAPKALREDRLDALREDRLDALRAVAMLWMAAFHLAFDLNHFGLLQPRQDFYADPLWTLQRTAIVSLFLLCAGYAQALALQGAAPGLAARLDRRFWRRWVQVAGCALLVSLGSALMFPRSWISFGVLHGIAVMLVVGRLLSPWRSALWLGGALALALPWLVAHPFFDTRWTNWVGLVTRKPVTEDYVPVLPWLGVMLWGQALGQALQARRRGRPVAVRPATRALAALGRWPLSFYMLHQPVLIGAIVAGQFLARA